MPILEKRDANFRTKLVSGKYTFTLLAGIKREETFQEWPMYKLTNKIDELTTKLTKKLIVSFSIDLSE